MKVVVDTNIIMSCLFKNGKHFRDRIYSESIHVYSCNFLFLEIFKHKNKIVKSCGMEENEILEHLYSLLQQISFTNETLLSKENRQNAFELCSGIDVKDAPFVALTLELGAVLWTGDKRLKEGLREKGFDRFFEIS
jgi:putative PIN family toxin of toxin-antitoxin system